jgi:hypothetical protein
MAIIVETWMAEDIEWGTEATSKTHPSGGTLNGYQVSLSTLSLAGSSGTASSQVWDDITTINAGAALTKTVTVTGAELGDFALASFDLDPQGMMMDARVTAANTVTVVMFNPTAGGLTLATTGTIRVLVFKTR